ncbi:MAG: hypothetical protein COA45_04990 [Zetaproteobacteria bacterium]|nr:MAG: hypothetical protein COA45_04990 [Zetaproteobacteria bacterium]
MAQESFEKDQVSNSKLYMLRCLIVMAHADGNICEDERAYMSALMNRLPLTKEQRDTLESDFDNQEDIGNLFRHINDPRYRGQVVYFARLMAHKDGIMHPSEQDLLDRLHSAATDGLDINAIRAETKKAVGAELAIHDINVDSNRPTKHGHPIPYFQLLDEFLLSLGIDLMK